MQTHTNNTPKTDTVIDAAEKFGLSAVPAVRQNMGILITDERAMTMALRLAETMCQNKVTIPQHLRGNVGDCLAVVLQATRWGMDPFVVAQKTFLVNGTLGYEAQLIAAVINTSSALDGRLRYEWFGPWQKIVGKFKMVESKKLDDNGRPKKFMVPDWTLADEAGLGVRVTGLIRGEQEPRVMETLMLQARTRNSTLWAEDPKQQIGYLSTKRWARLYLPEVLLGVYDPDELSQSTSVYMGHADVVEPAKPEASEELVQAAYAQADKGRDAFIAWWQATPKWDRDLLGDKIDDFRQRAADADKLRTVENPAAAPVAAKVEPTTPAKAADKPADAIVKPARARAPAPSPKAPPAPSFDAATIKQRLDSAADLDALYIAADLINHAPQEDQAALSALFDHRLASMS